MLITTHSPMQKKKELELHLQRAVVQFSRGCVRGRKHNNVLLVSSQCLEARGTACKIKRRGCGCGTATNWCVLSCLYRTNRKNAAWMDAATARCVWHHSHSRLPPVNSNSRLLSCVLLWARCGHRRAAGLAAIANCTPGKYKYVSLLMHRCSTPQL